MPCADFGDDNEHLKAYISRYSFSVLNLINYIDYQEVIEPNKGKVQKTFTWVRAKKLNIWPNNVFKLYAYRFTEHRVSLQDHLWQMLRQPT